MGGWWGVCVGGGSSILSRSLSKDIRLQIKDLFSLFVEISLDFLIVLSLQLLPFVLADSFAHRSLPQVFGEAMVQRVLAFLAEWDGRALASDGVACPAGLLGLVIPLPRCVPAVSCLFLLTGLALRFGALPLFAPLLPLN